MDKTEKATQWLEKYDIIPWEDVVQALTNLLEEHEKETIQACQAKVDKISYLVFDSSEEAKLVHNVIKNTKLD